MRCLQERITDHVQAMPFNPSPRFKTKHWRALYESCILEFATLRDLTADQFSIFVTIDSELWGADDTKPAQIGL
jgi:hypothetical protein